MSSFKRKEYEISQKPKEMKSRGLQIRNQGTNFYKIHKVDIEIHEKEFEICWTVLSEHSLPLLSVPRVLTLGIWQFKAVNLRPIKPLANADPRYSYRYRSSASLTMQSQSYTHRSETSN